MDATIDLEEIAAFVHVARTGSFTAAERKTGIPKSTLSRSVQRLETSLGMTLLQRSTRRVLMTTAGRTFYAEAEPHIAALQDALLAVREEGAEPRGLLRVTAPIDLAEPVLTELSVRFLRKHPDIQLELELSSRRYNLVEEGFDMALRASERIDDPDLIARKITTTEFHLCAAPSYLKSRPAPQTPAELAGHDCVLFRPKNGRSRWQLTRSEKQPRKRNASSTPWWAEGRLHANDLSVIKAAILAGAGIGALPSFLVLREYAQGALVRVLPRFTIAGGALYVVYPAQRKLPRKVIAFRDFIVENFEHVLTESISEGLLVS